MRELALHYEKMRTSYPNDRLLILLDIDGTILDKRYMKLHLLRQYDRAHGTEYFRNLSVLNVTHSENHIQELLDRLSLSREAKRNVIEWYAQNAATPAAVLESHRPFRGVLELIRWFQLQPNTFVGLNSSRPEHLREDTIHCLNKLGEEFRVRFSNELLFMNPENMGVEQAKMEGVKYFQKLGYKIFAAIDNELENLKAVAQADAQQEIILLHASAIFRSKRKEAQPSRIVDGKSYDLTELILEEKLPQHIQLVWHGVNDGSNFRQFLSSAIHWGEIDVRSDPISLELVLRQDPFDDIPPEHEIPISLDEALRGFKASGRGVKLDLKEGGLVLYEILEKIESAGIEESNLWFNGNIERLQEGGFRTLSRRFPKAILQCPVDFLAPLILSTPDAAKNILDMLTQWGVNRFSISWLTPNKRQIFDRMDRWKFEVNIYNVPNLEFFLQAVLFLPRSITSNFNFPKWSYYGSSAGENLPLYQCDLVENA